LFDDVPRIARDLMIGSSIKYTLFAWTKLLWISLSCTLYFDWNPDVQNSLQLARFSILVQDVCFICVDF
jgi:hypothetical protein